MTDLSNVKVGDEVILISGHGRTFSRTKVEKVGKVHITADGYKFRMNGHGIGERWYTPHLILFDQARWDEYMQRVRNEQAVKRLNELNWHRVGVGTVHEVCALLDRVEAQ